MIDKTESARLTAQTGWTAQQRNHLRRLMREGAMIAYWNSDQHGRPANHAMEPMKAREWTARPGLVQEVAGPLETCSARALHATLEPHRWAGVRVWLVGLVGTVKEDAGDRKFGALRREIVGEILPECAFTDGVGARLGRKDLYSANLTGANLIGANLTRANLYSANLSSANLTRANLYSANLSSANLTRANLTRANLTRANLESANLESANLFINTCLDEAYYPTGQVPVGWERKDNGRLIRKK